MMSDRARSARDPNAFARRLRDDLECRLGRDDETDAEFWRRQSPPFGGATGTRTALPTREPTQGNSLRHDCP